MNHYHIIARADDAGVAESADRAILEIVEKGIVRNVSLMAVGPSIAHAADLLACNKKICFGLHATLNVEWDNVRWGPVSPPETVSSILGGGGSCFTRSPHHFLANPPVIEEVMMELQAKLDKLRGLGFHVGYEDAHGV